VFSVFSVAIGFQSAPRGSLAACATPQGGTWIGDNVGVATDSSAEPLRRP